MNALKMLALALVIGGGLALAYGGFSYTKQTHTADVGPLHMEVQDRERVNIPLWAGLAAVIGGSVLFFVPRTS